MIRYNKLDGKKAIQRFYQTQLKPNDSAFWLWVSVIVMVVGFWLITGFYK